MQTCVHHFRIHASINRQHVYQCGRCGQFATKDKELETETREAFLMVENEHHRAECNRCV